MVQIRSRIGQEENSQYVYNLDFLSNQMKTKKRKDWKNEKKTENQSHKQVDRLQKQVPHNTMRSTSVTPVTTNNSAKTVQDHSTYPPDAQSSELSTLLQNYQQQCPVQSSCYTDQNVVVFHLHSL